MPHPPPRADGKIESVVTSLEMFAPLAGPPIAPPRADLAIVQAVHPTVSFYRYLYDTVGAPWLWTDRRKLGDAELAAVVQHPAVQVFVLHLAGVPAGAIDEMQQHAAALDMTEKAVAEADAFVGAFDQPGNVGHDERLIKCHDRPQVRVLRGERIVGDLGMSSRDA